MPQHTVEISMLRVIPVYVMPCHMLQRSQVSQPMKLHGYYEKYNKKYKSAMLTMISTTSIAISAQKGVHY